MSREPVVAYFSMEIGLEPSIPTYSGGLGVLAGDMLRSAADLGVPMVGVTLLRRRGYFHQRLDPNGSQREEAVRWPVDDRTRCLDARANIDLEGRPVALRAWEYRVHGISGAEVPIYLLDTDLPENAEAAAASPTHSMVEMTAIACARRRCWGSVVCASWARSVTPASTAFT